MTETLSLLEHNLATVSIVKYIGFCEVQIVLRLPENGKIGSQLSRTGYKDRQICLVRYLNRFHRHYNLTQKESLQIESALVNQFKILGWEVSDLPRKPDTKFLKFMKHIGLCHYTA